MKKAGILLFAVAGSAVFYTSCKKKEYTADSPLNLPSKPFDYAGQLLPNHFLTDAGGPLPTSVNGIDNTPSGNAITNDGATLGRVLFYDRNLSINRRVACANCHRGEFAFSDTAKLSKGHSGGNTRRHSMSLINARYYQRGRFFWDERAANLENQVLMPFQDAVEMGMTLDQVVDRVKEQPFYASLFQKAFGSQEVSSDKISKALAQFVRSIVSYQSKYDAGRAQVNNPGAPFPNFTQEENQGKALFLQPPAAGGAGCFGCHTTEAFVNSNPGPLNNGLDLSTTADQGALETFVGQPRFAGAFKTPSLRNIELSGPYMHDGRFKTLDQVIEHYNSGVQAHPNLAAPLKDANGNPIRLNLTQAQKSALLAFLKTLTDRSVESNPMWSNPFK